MNIEYIDNGSKDCPLIRLYGDDPDSIQLFIKNIVLLLSGKIKSKKINDLKGFNGINQCQVDMQLAPTSKGIIHIKGNNFKCLLSKDDWETVIGLLEPFSKKSKNGKYQWLNETSNISLLVSTYENGQW